MELILWRHAEAEDAAAGGDLARALTKRGRKQAGSVGRWLARRLDDDWVVLASPARRAAQTAKGLGRDFEEREALGPAAGAEEILREAGWPGGKRSVLIVGHQPTLGEAAARLLGLRGGLEIRKGAAWWFAAKRGEVFLKAVMDPELAGGRG
ncbi:MAG TPA: histidine phosphatase family protein [Usitatibacter sp.]|nr:histidine phosphatase family protein [Usitatibacter sp.]